jgi:glycerol-3-phosphate dehydrogenase
MTNKTVNISLAENAIDYDIAVIGGGIHGVGVAQAAAAAGYRTVLLEQQHLAYGTSRWSSKLIHGGLRYLENFEFGLVRESLKERELLIKLAPELVKRQKFTIPVYKETSRRPWLIGLGLTAYTVLAGGNKHTRFRRIPQEEWPELDGLKQEGLDSVLQYTDAQTDDAKLTQAVMNSAIELGAELRCPAKFERANRVDGGVEVQYEMNGKIEKFKTRTLVNAAGPWAAELLSTTLGGLPDFPVDKVQGTHIELPSEISKGCYYLEVPADKRAVFAMPWKGRTLLGTTEFTYEGDPHQVHSRDEAVEYLLNVYRHYFPSQDDTVLDRWAGLRVLPAATDSAFKRSRETQMPVDNEKHPVVLSIFGGKLTGYRATAEKVIEKLQPSLPKVAVKALTSQLPLSLDGVEETKRSN